MEYTDDNMQLVAEKISESMSLEELQAYVAEDYFFQMDQDSELFEYKVKELGLDKTDWSFIMEYSTIEGVIRQNTMNPINKEQYKISLGLTDEEISSIKEGQPVSFIFTDENFPKINVAIEHKEDDLPLDNYMNLSVDTLS